VWAGGDPGEIEERANVRINTVRRLDAGTTTPATDDIVIAIDQADGDRLVVIAGSNGVDAIPVESR
jgi:hypothetical protein